VNIVGLKRITTGPTGNETYNTDFVGFEKTTLELKQMLLVIGRESDLADLVRDTSKSKNA